jgi:hypothetical protein
MPSKQKVKGSGWEREAAKYLSDTYNEPFQRNISGSGAFLGGKNIIRKSTLSESQIRNSKGDIVPPDNWVHFNAEAKFYSDFAFHQLFDTSAQLESWLDQLMTVADTNDVNILLAKFNRKGKYVAVQANDYWDRSCSYTLYTSIKHGHWLIYSFENFFNLNRDHLKTYSCKI